MNEEWNKALWGFGIGVLSLLTLSGPLMRFTDPAFMSTIGLWTAMAIGFAHYWIILKGEAGKWAIRLIVFPVALVFVIILVAQRVASNDSNANDRRCMAIQLDMLSARPRRADGPDLFQALGCRPQGEGSVYAVPERPIKKLKNAAHAPNI